MENWFIAMIISVSVLTCASIGFGIYSWILHKKYPKTIRAKVTRIETLPNGRYRYFFAGKSNGLHHMADVNTYKSKKFKTSEKVAVHMGTNGETCYSSYPIWSIIVSVTCILLAAIIALFYYSEKRKDEAEKEAAGQIYQETGYYIVTDKETLMYGDNLGLVVVKDAAEYVSTGDYGGAIFLGTPKYENGIMPSITSLGDNIQKDGTVENIPEEVIKQVKSLGYTIDETVTNSEELMPTTPKLEGEHDHDHDHDHDHESESTETTGPTETVGEAENTNETQSNTDIT